MYNVVKFSQSETGKKISKLAKEGKLVDRTAHVYPPDNVLPGEFWQDNFSGHVFVCGPRTGDYPIAYAIFKHELEDF